MVSPRRKGNRHTICINNSCRWLQPESRNDSIFETLVASGVEMVMGMCVAGRLLVMLPAEAFTGVAYVFVVYRGRISIGMYFCR